MPEGTRPVVRLLTAQTVALGLTSALLVIPATSIFLSSFGSQWLPVTYIAVAVAGAGVSTAIAAAVRQRPLVDIGAITLGGSAAVYFAAWLVLAVADGVWVSAVLVPMFAISLHLGFVFIGGQAGRLLDVGQIKTSFPRIVRGFVVGFLVGGLVSPPLLQLLGSTQNLLLATTAAGLSFMALLLVTAARFPEELRHVEATVKVERPALGKLLAGRFVLLVFTYQVLSAMGTQVLDFLVFDRAAARYEDADELARFFSAYTVTMNLVNILFLTLVSGWMIRRFGLRVGLAVNPLAVAALALAMAVAVAAAGPASLVLFVLVVSGQIVDLTLTDGATRTSVAATYQVISVEEHASVQAFVEGVGVPVAIGVTGGLLLVWAALDLGISVVIGFAVVLAVGWSVAAVATYRGYRHQIAAQLRRHPFGAVVSLDAAQAQEVSSALFTSADAGNVRFALNLLAETGVAPPEADLRTLAHGPDPALRLLALAELAVLPGGDAAGEELIAEATPAASSPDPAVRRAAARALGGAPPDRALALLRDLLADDDRGVRSATLDGLRPGHTELLPTVLDAFSDPATSGAAASAIDRFGDAAVPAVAELLTASSPPVPAAVRRSVRACRPHLPQLAAASLGTLLAHPDRVAAAEVARALSRVDGVGHLVRDDVDTAIRQTAEHAAATFDALEAVGSRSTPLRRALEDELALAREQTLACLAVRYGPAVVDSIRLGLEQEDPSRRALAVELLDVTASRADAALVRPVIDPRLTPADRAAHFPPATAPEPSPDERLRDLVADPDRRWRSAWLAATALWTASEESPAVAAVLAAGAVGSADPVLAETAAAVLASAGARPLPAS